MFLSCPPRSERLATALGWLPALDFRYRASDSYMILLLENRYVPLFSVDTKNEFYGFSQKIDNFFKYAPNVPGKCDFDGFLQIMKEK